MPHPSWNVTQRHNWNSVKRGQCAIPNSEDIIVIAHAGPTGIGNYSASELDIDAARFIQLINQNVVGTPNNRIFMSICAIDGIAQFTAQVVMGSVSVWQNVRLFGHSFLVVGVVPRYTPNSLDWTEIYRGR
jgi:hypothetical protein